MNQYESISINSRYLFATSAIAGNGENLVNRIVKRSVSYPEDLKSRGVEANVRVTVKVLEDGKLEVVSINSRSEELKQSVKTQLLAMKLKNYLPFVGQEFSYTFKFEVE